jgi:two-component system response regulator AtoC
MRVLLLDPDESSRDDLRRAFASLGCPVRGYASPGEGEKALSEFDPQIVVAAVSSRGEGAGHFVSLAHPRRAVYALVDAGELDSAVLAMDAGADDFLWRPVSPARVAQLFAAAAGRLDREAAAEETRILLSRAEMRDGLPGRSPRWISTLASLERAAQSNASVLMTGESGTEKDAAALALHRLSPRGSGRFAYISEGESLDLATRQAGLGTLFLQNVEATSTGYQEMLLARLESGRPIRFVVALDEDPRDALEGGRLLHPLYEALSESIVHLPPLREREGDAAILLAHFLEKLDPALSFEPDALDALSAHDWPGNTYELKELVRRAARLSEGTIGPTVVRSVLARPLPRTKLRRRKAPVVKIAVGDSLADVERRLISKTLEFARGNKRKTAELLKLSLKTIYNKIKEYGLEH